jgi:glycosyltransferase involved in cell wall biosynthesis
MNTFTMLFDVRHLPRYNRVIPQRKLIHWIRSILNAVAILHYACPPIVGGVEATIAHHARGLVRLGYPVRVVSGKGAQFDDNVEVHINPHFASTHPQILRAKAALDAGQVPSEFPTLVNGLVAELRGSLAGCPVCIAHNVPTLHKNLPLTAALAQLSAEREIRLIAWCHDLAWTSTQYRSELHDGYPWDLLRQPWANTQYVAVSESRQMELADLLGIEPPSIPVVPAGIAPASFLHWTPTTEYLERQLHLLDSDGLLLVPARLTRRKNIELALRILSELRHQSGLDFRLVVTGPPGPHNPANPGYLGELLALRQELGLADVAHFLYECGEADSPLIPDDATMANLYQIADALLFPTLQEGFGIPILEAGLAALPVFCAEIPPLRATGQQDVTYFDPLHEPPANIAARILAALRANPSFRLRVRVRRTCRWESVIRERLIPLLEET